MKCQMIFFPINDSGILQLVNDILRQLWTSVSQSIGAFGEHFAVHVCLSDANSRSFAIPSFLDRGRESERQQCVARRHNFPLLCHVRSGR